MHLLNFTSSTFHVRGSFTLLLSWGLNLLLRRWYTIGISMFNVLILTLILLSRSDRACLGHQRCVPFLNKLLHLSEKYENVHEAKNIWRQAQMEKRRRKEDVNEGVLRKSERLWSCWRRETGCLQPLPSSHIWNFLTSAYLSSNPSLGTDADSELSLQNGWLSLQAAGFLQKPKIEINCCRDSLLFLLLQWYFTNSTLHLRKELGYCSIRSVCSFE